MRLKIWHPSQKLAPVVRTHPCLPSPCNCVCWCLSVVVYHLTIPSQHALPLAPAPVAVNCTSHNKTGQMLLTGAADGVIRLFGNRMFLLRIFKCNSSMNNFLKLEIGVVRPCVSAQCAEADLQILRGGGGGGSGQELFKGGFRVLKKASPWKFSYWQAKKKKKKPLGV